MFYVKPIILLPKCERGRGLIPPFSPFTFIHFNFNANKTRVE